MAMGERQPLAQEQPQKPNVLFILTDDQAPEDLATMSNVQSLLVNEGTSFSNAFTTTPICCPSRVSFMRGQYAHNHGVLTNQSTDQGGYERFIELGLQDSTVATWLDDAGYSTFYAGKFLNGYEGSNTDVVPGWDEWYTFGSNIREQYTINENGTLKTYTQDQQHETYYLRDRAEAFIRNHAQGAPWFAWVSTHAPHPPYSIAPEFQGSYNSAEMPKPPSYNEADVSDKPAWIQAQPLLDDDCSTDKGKLDCHQEAVEEWRARQEALMSVDVMVRDLTRALAETKQLRRTYIVLSSDNGFLLYRHRVYSKGTPYEESQGVPFVVRGPGVQQGVVSEELVANIDLAPTIARWAGVRVPEYVDGRSLRRVLEGTATTPRRQYLLFEFFRGLNGSNRVVRSYGGVRTAGGETYVEYGTGEKEYYDLGADPWQLESAHAAPKNAKRLGALSVMLSDLKGCKDASCRVADVGP
jgi:N-acetylglucosamine-6-sulfatase